MKAFRINPQELIGGLALLGFGGAVMAQSSQYAFGTINRPGPGAFPFGVGAVICLLAIPVLLEGRINKSELAMPQLDRILPIILGIVAFALLITTLGLVAATFAVVLLAALAERPVRLPTATILATGLAVFAVVVFIVLLKLRLKAFW